MREGPSQDPVGAGRRRQAEILRTKADGAAAKAMNPVSPLTPGAAPGPEGDYGPEDPQLAAVTGRGRWRGALSGHRVQPWAPTIASSNPLNDFSWMRWVVLCYQYCSVDTSSRRQF